MQTIHHDLTMDGRRFTVVGIYDSSFNKTVKFGVAICGPQDNFARKLGRTIAEGRAQKHPTLIKHIKYSLSDDKEGFKNLNKLGFEVTETVKEDPYLYQELLTEQYKVHKKPNKSIKK